MSPLFTTPLLDATNNYIVAPSPQSSNFRWHLAVNRRIPSVPVAHLVTCRRTCLRVALGPRGVQLPRMTIFSGLSNSIARSPRYHWWVYGAIAIGAFLMVMDMTSVNIALPRIADHFESGISTVQWVTLSYVLSTSVMLMPMGRLSDMVGRKRVYLAGFLVFIVAAALSGSAQAFPQIIGAKIMQGIGSAAIQANGIAMIVEAFPERQRGKALGLYMTIIGAGAVSGPIIGGILVSTLGWRAVFFAGVPLGLAAVLAALTVIRGRAPTQEPGQFKRRAFDWPGAMLSSGALVSFLLAMTNAHRLGWSSPPVIAGFAVAFVMLSGFLWWQRRTPDPMLDLDFFQNRAFTMGMSARSVAFLGGSAVFFMMPFYLIQGLGIPAHKAGFILVPGALFVAVTSPIFGFLSDKIGTRWLSVFGLALAATALFVLSRLSIDSHPAHVVLGLSLYGIGWGAFVSPNNNAILGSVAREKYGIASALLNLSRSSASVTGIALATTIVTFTMGSLGFEPSLAAVTESGGEGVRRAFVTGMSKAFLVSGGLMLLAVVVSGLRGESRAQVPVTPGLARQHQASHRAEGDD